MKKTYQKPELIAFESAPSSIALGNSAPPCVTPCTYPGIVGAGAKASPASKMLILDAKGNPVITKE